MDVPSLSWKNGTLGLGAVSLAHLAYPDATEVGLMTAAAVATTAAGYVATDWLVSFPHRWNWIKPLHVTLVGPLGVDNDVKPAKYIKIPRNYMKREDIGRIKLPETFVGADTKVITHIVQTKLGLTNVSVQYRLAGRKPYLIIKQTPRPPTKVMLDDYRTEALASPESAPLIGIGPKGVQVSVDLDAESPHILVSASTGGGKSVITRTMAAQMLFHGAQYVFLDFKRHSHRWARGLPQVEYCRDIGDIHDALVSLGREGHRRNLVVDEWEGNSAPDVGPRLGILLEEANATISKLKRHWTRIRKTKADEDGPADPKESPAIDALREILFMGRAVKMHVLLVAQSATAASLGGPEVRECFATRILARYTQNAWKMLVPEVHPIPRSTRHIGRAQVVLGGVAIETQVLFTPEKDATELATAGEVAPPLSLSRHVTHQAHSSRSEGSEQRDVTRPLTLVKAPEPTHTLAEAAREGIVPMKADALRQAKRRDPEFPAGADGRWSASELERWYRNRPRKTA